MPGSVTAQRFFLQMARELSEKDQMKREQNTDHTDKRDKNKRHRRRGGTDKRDKRKSDTTTG